MKPQTYASLLAVAAAAVDQQQDRFLHAVFEQIDDWQAIAEQAEIHGLSVMLGQFAHKQALGLPRNLQLQLKALTIRHQKVLAAREIVLSDVIDTFEQNNIQFALLKGAALSPLIYDPPWLRPMRDIDILVRNSDAKQAQTLLRSIGFKNEDFNSGFLFEHHHLPNSTRKQDGYTISLEVHHDALSGDVNDSIKLEQLIDKPRAFKLANKQAYALGHRDMLKHLCYHTFEPAERIKLGSMIDLIRYATVFVGEINWRDLEQTQPLVCNTLRCVHALIPLPGDLQAKLGLMPENWHPKGIGCGFMPLSRIAKLASGKEKLSALLVPSAWWMHIFYKVSPGKSLSITRLIHHPLTIARWLFRRYRAAHKSKQH